MKPTRLSISQIQQISVPVRNLDRAVSFYRDVLELELRFQVPGMAFFDCQGITLMLSVPENPQFDPPGSTIYFRVETIQEAYETLLERGVETVGKPHKIAEMNGVQTWMTFFKDTEANLHALTSEVPASK